MSFPKYFQQFPNLQYTIRANHAGVEDRIAIKDYFHLMKIREDIFAEDIFYTSYVIKNGQRPDQISYEVYGDEQYYWVILQVNGIVNYYDEWPLSQLELDEYILKKYGSDSKSGQVHHYETVETFDSEDNLVLPGGLVVSSDFVYTYPTTPGATTSLTSFPVEKTNRQYEIDLNESKAEIVILNPRYIYDWEREVKKYANNLPDDVQSEIDISEVF